MVESRYVPEVDELAGKGKRLAPGTTWDALISAAAASAVMGNKRILLTPSTETRCVPHACRDAATRPGSPCSPARQQAGRARAEVSIEDDDAILPRRTSAPVSSRRKRTASGDGDRRVAA